MVRIDLTSAQHGLQSVIFSQLRFHCVSAK
jgi:hypothetical protein